MVDNVWSKFFWSVSSRISSSLGTSINQPTIQFIIEGHWWADQLRLITCSPPLMRVLSPSWLETKQLCPVSLWPNGRSQRLVLRRYRCALLRWILEVRGFHNHKFKFHCIREVWWQLHLQIFPSPHPRMPVWITKLVNQETFWFLWNDDVRDTVLNVMACQSSSFSIIDTWCKWFHHLSGLIQ